MADNTLLKTQKVEARRKARSALAAIPGARFAEIGLEVCRFLQNDTGFQNAKTVFCFASFGDEMDTNPIMQAVLDAGKRLCVPRILGPGQMVAAEIDAISQLTPGAYGVRAPSEEAHILPPSEIDLTLLPCLSATPDGRRLGHGGGYYDFFLEKYSGKTILLCPGALLQDDLPCGPLDCSADRVLTENGFV